MSDTRTRRHVFISHHHADDKQVDKLTKLLSKTSDIRNSSIRAKPANQRRLEQGLVSDRAIKRLLRMKISWAGTVVVLVGKKTHQRPWVDWEIKEANAQGKGIVGVFARGATDADLPPALEDYASSIVAWNTKSISAALDGASRFEHADGSERARVHSAGGVVC